MPKNNISFTKPTNNSSLEDALSQVLNAMRVSGSLLLKETYKSPWAVEVPDSNALNKLFEMNNNTRIAAFHLVEQGHINIKQENGEETLVEAGEMAVCFSGLGHTLYQDNEKNTVPFQALMRGNNNIFQPDESEQSSCTSLICGVFLLHDTQLNPLLASLPKILKFDISSQKDTPRLFGIINLLTQEFDIKASDNIFASNYASGNSYIVQRYLEILCAEAIRVHVAGLPKESTGWLSALKDPVIGRAIEIIHSQPGYNWSVKSLANEVTISPSRFAARFSSTLGESPMIYVTKWRMFVASRLLEGKQLTIDQIANDVGYESLPAFSRAFKRHVGIPPAAWRACH